MSLLKISSPREVNSKRSFNDSVGYSTNGIPEPATNGATTKQIPRKYEKLEDYMLQLANELDQRESFYVLDLADILWKVQEWRKRLPNVEIFYAVKANSDPVLLRLFVLMGLSFDCATEGEIRMVLDAGASSKNILWAHTIKTVQGLAYARSVGVDFMTFDNVDELEKIHRVFPSARLILRLSPSVVKCKFDLSQKFGCSMDEAVVLLKRAKDIRMKIEGVSFHVGALCTDPDSFASTIRDCKEVFRLGREIGHQFSVLDIGGGFSGATGTDSIFEELTQRIGESLDEHFSDEGIRFIAEPGCYLVGSAMNFVCTVIGKRKVKSGNIQRHYFVNNGIYGSFFRDIDCYGIQVKPLLVGSENNRRSEFSSVLFGQTCCSEDVISKCCVLPDMEVGECVVWENIGAYSQVLCGTFCGVPLPRIVHVFKQCERLNLDNVSYKDDVRNFIREQAVYIGKSGQNF